MCPSRHRINRGINSAEAAVREMWEPPAFFEQLGVRYIGPLDGHDIEGLESALANAASFDGPIVVHVFEGPKPEGNEVASVTASGAQGSWSSGSVTLPCATSCEPIDSGTAFDVNVLSLPLAFVPAVASCSTPVIGLAARSRVRIRS